MGSDADQLSGRGVVCREITATKQAKDANKSTVIGMLEYVLEQMALLWWFPYHHRYSRNPSKTLSPKYTRAMQSRRDYWW
jgi:hypothetical protein